MEYIARLYQVYDVYFYPPYLPNLRICFLMEWNIMEKLFYIADLAIHSRAPKSNLEDDPEHGVNKSSLLCITNDHTSKRI